MSENVSAARSKTQITLALLKLMEQKSFKDIKVTELCHAAEVTRPTFYNHFSSKEEILEKYIERILASFIGMCAQGELNNPRDVLESFFLFCKRNGAFLTLLYKQESFGCIRRKALPCLDILFNMVAFTPSEITKKKKGFHDAFLSLGIIGVLEHWIEEGMKTRPDELADYVSEIFYMDECSRD